MRNSLEDYVKSSAPSSSYQRPAATPDIDREDGTTTHPLGQPAPNFVMYIPALVGQPGSNWALDSDHRNAFREIAKKPFLLASWPRAGWLACHSDHCRIVAKAPDAFDESVLDPRRWRGVAAQYPKVLAARFANNRPCIIVRMIQHPIICEKERPEKRNLQFRAARTLDHLGLALSGADGAIRAVCPTGVQHPD